MVKVSKRSNAGQNYCISFVFYLARRNAERSERGLIYHAVTEKNRQRTKDIRINRGCVIGKLLFTCNERGKKESFFFSRDYWLGFSWEIELSLLCFPLSSAHFLFYFLPCRHGQFIPVVQRTRNQKKITLRQEPLLSNGLLPSSSTFKALLILWFSSSSVFQALAYIPCIYITYISCRHVALKYRNAMNYYGIFDSSWVLEIFLFVPRPRHDKKNFSLSTPSFQIEGFDFHRNMYQYYRIWTPHQCLVLKPLIQGLSKKGNYAL